MPEVLLFCISKQNLQEDSAFLQDMDEFNNGVQLFDPVT